MRMNRIFVLLLLNMFLFNNSLTQTLPFIYEVENTCADCPLPPLPSFKELPTVQSLPDPFEWSDGRCRISHFSDWRYRRAEIGAEIANYEIGIKPPRPDSIQASYSNGILTVNVTVNGNTLTLTSRVILPKGAGPFPAIIGMNSPNGSIPSTIFTIRNIARITFNHDQVTTYANQFTGRAPSNADPYFRLYPSFNLDNIGQYSAWAWGVSRIIDGLELVQNDLPIDLKHIAVTGCSYAGKMALFAGAFDERIALTIAQESGGGGATSWRYSASEPSGTVEGISQTSHDWFLESLFQFGGSNVAKLPLDHHELMAMCAPRALYVTANPDYIWLSNASFDVCCRACKKVYDALGISDRFGFSIVGGHIHCSVPNNQMLEIEAFVDKFLLGIDSVNTDISTSPYSLNLSPWITWTTPTLTDGQSYYERTPLLYPTNLQKDIDTCITFIWNKANDAEKYFIQLSIDPTFKKIDKSDSTVADTLITMTGLLKGKRYYWRVQAKSSNSLGPWSEVRNFTTHISLPDKP